MQRADAGHSDINDGDVQLGPTKRARAGIELAAASEPHPAKTFVHTISRGADGSNVKREAARRPQKQRCPFSQKPSG